MLRVGVGVVRHAYVALRPQRGDLVGQRRLVMGARRAQHPGGGSRLRQWVQDLGGGGRPDAGGGGTRPTRRSVAPESVDDGSRRYTHLRAASTSVHSASGVGDAMSPGVARRDVRRGERVGGFSHVVFVHNSASETTLAIGYTTVGTFRSTAPKYGASYYPIPRHVHALASPESVASSFSASTAIHAWSAGVNPRCVPLAHTITPSFPTGVTATACAFFGR